MGSELDEDILEILDGHFDDYNVPPVQQPRLIEGQKCDLCGSTAIDHTEMHCQMNRMGNAKITTTGGNGNG